MEVTYSVLETTHVRCVGTLIGASSGWQQKLSPLLLCAVHLGYLRGTFIDCHPFPKLILLEKVLHSRKINSKSPGLGLNFTAIILIANILRDFPVHNNATVMTQYNWLGSWKWWSLQNGVQKQNDDSVAAWLDKEFTVQRQIPRVRIKFLHYLKRSWNRCCHSAK